MFEPQKKTSAYAGEKFTPLIHIILSRNNFLLLLLLQTSATFV